jgi:metallo-beta-lactamase family protein
VDSPLAVKATRVYDDHEECWDKEAYRQYMAGDRPFQFKSLSYVSETEDSKKLNEEVGPLVIISASGMCEGGRILHHLRNSIEDPRNIILFIGYQAEHTLGRRIVEHRDPIRIFGEEYDLQARVHTINALSAHADGDGIVEYLRPALSGAEAVFVVHGEEDASLAIARRLEENGAASVTVPTPGETARLD